MSWRVAQSLLVLRDQINAAYPNRSKASDGTIGDEAHQASYSDHNPDDDVDGDGVGEGPGVDDIVRALDITHDPGHGCDIDRMSDALANSRDARISYVIANRAITGPEYDWVWTTYDGDDPHTGHLHLSVVGDDRADDPRPWSIGASTDAASTANGVSMILVKNGPSIVLTDWATWHDQSIKYDQCMALKASGVPLVDVTAAQMGAILALPAPRTAAKTLALTGEQVAAIAAEAALVLGTRVEDLEAQMARISAAVVAAGKVAGGAA